MVQGSRTASELGIELMSRLKKLRLLRSVKFPSSSKLMSLHMCGSAKRTLAIN